MATSNFEFIPKIWAYTKGAGVTIAHLDTGVNFKHPAMAHLQQEGCRFDATALNFNPKTSPGNDMFGDVGYRGKPHGTATAGVIAARTDDGTMGLANDARMLIYRLRDDRGEVYIDYFIKALQSAIEQKVDVIAAPLSPTMRNQTSNTLIDSLMEKLEQEKILLVTTVSNTNKLEVLNTLPFPASRPESIVTAVLSDGLLADFGGRDQLNQAIRYVWPQAMGNFCDDPDTTPFAASKWRNSQAVTALSAIIALRIAAWKAAEGNQYQRRSREDIMVELGKIALPFVPAALINDKTFRMYAQNI